MDDVEYISRKTWSRNIKSVNKVGYLNGAADGQVSAFQSSFDMGYKQGFGFGIKLGSRNAQNGHESNVDFLQDQRKINCNLCMNGIPLAQNIVNIYNTQQEKNTELLKQRRQ